MTVETTKVCMILLDPADERMFVERLTQSVDDVQIIDGSRWSSPTPPTRRSLDGCRSDIVYLWSPGVRPTLPSRARGDGFDGPSSGVVIQWRRSRIDDDGALRSGRLAFGYDTSDVAMARFATTTFTVLRSVTTGRVVRLDGAEERGCRIGPSARLGAVAGTHRLRHDSVDVSYTVR